MDEEAYLIEQLNDLNGRWRDDFEDVWQAAAAYGLLDAEEEETYGELDFS
jgi:hypothetical protein